jgi:hypothetical protein
VTSLTEGSKLFLRRLNLHKIGSKDNPSRRAVLAGASATATVVGGMTLAPALARSAVTQEKPELIAPGAELDQAEAAFHAAHGARARAAFDAVCPAVPSELVLRGDEEIYFIGEPEKDIEDNSVYFDPKAPSRIILTLKHLANWAEDYSPRTKFGRLIREKLEVARDYEQRVAEAAVQTGIKEAIDARQQAIKRIDVLLGKISEINASSEEGILIKARAILARGKIGYCNKIWVTVVCGPGIAGDITTVLKGQHVER